MRTRSPILAGASSAASFPVEGRVSRAAMAARSRLARNPWTVAGMSAVPAGHQAAGLVLHRGAASGPQAVVRSQRRVQETALGVAGIASS